MAPDVGCAPAVLVQIEVNLDEALPQSPAVENPLFQFADPSLEVELEAVLDGPDEGGDPVVSDPFESDQPQESEDEGVTDAAGACRTDDVHADLAGAGQARDEEGDTLDLSATSYDGAAAIPEQMVETLHAPNSPPPASEDLNETDGTVFRLDETGISGVEDADVFSLVLELGENDSLVGSGYWAGAVISNGVISPGNSPGIQTLDSLILGSSSTTVIEIAGTGEDDYDQIHVTNLADLDGTLEIRLLGGFVPSLGNTFDFLTFGSIEDGFSTSTGLFGFGDGNLFFEVEKLDDRLQLVVTEAPGNGDLHIDTTTTAMDDALGNVFSDYFEDATTSVTGILGVSDLAIPLAGSFDFVKTASGVVEIGATGNTVFLGSNCGEANAVGVEITSAEGGILANASGVATNVSGSAALVGVDGVTLSGTLTLQVNTTGAAVNESVAVGAGSVDIVYGDAAEIKQYTGTVEFGAADFVTISGDFAFDKTGTTPDTTIRAAVANGAVSMSAGTVEVGLSAANVGLILNEDGTYAVDGTGEISVTAPGLTASGTASVRKNNTGADVTESISIGVVDVDLDVANGVESIFGTGVSVSVADFVGISGDFGFRKSGTGIDAVARNVTATLDTGSSSAGVQNGELALVLGNDGGRALYAQGDFRLTGDDFASAAGTVTVKQNTSGADVGARAVAVDGITVNAPAITAGASSVSGTGLSFTVAGSVHIEGDLDFEKSGTDVTAAVADATAFLGTGYGTADEVGVKATGASGALLITDTGIATSITGNAAAIVGVDGLGLSGAGLELRINTTGAAVDQTVTTPAGDVTINIANGADVCELTGGALTLDLQGLVQLTGQVVFTDASNGTQKILAAGEQLTGLIGAGGKGIQLSGGQLAVALIEDADGSWGYAAQGSANAAAVGLTDVTVLPGSTIGIEVNKTGAAVNETVTLSNGTTTIDIDFVAAAEVCRFDISNLDVELAGAFLDLVDDAATYVAGVRDTLTVDSDDDGNFITNSVLAEQMPGINASLDRLLGVSALLDLGAFVRHYLDPENVETPDDTVDPLDYWTEAPTFDDPDAKVATLQGLLDYLNAAWLPHLEGDGSQRLALELTGQGFQFRFEDQPSYTQQALLDFGEAFTLLGLTFDANIELDLAIEARVGLALDIDWLDNQYSFDVSQLDLQAAGQADDLLFSGTIGALAVNLGLDSDHSAAGLALSGAADYVDGVFSFTAGDNTVSLDMPVFATLAGTDLYSPVTVPQVHVAGTMYGNAEGYAATTEDFGQLANFRNVTAAQMIQMFSDFRDYLESDVERSPVLLTQLPFVYENLKNRVPFSEAFGTQVYDVLNFTRPRVDLTPIRDNGAITKDGQTFTAPGAGFTADLQYEYLSFLDAEGNVVRTFQVKAVVDGDTVTVLENAPETVTGQRFVVHEEIKKIQTVQEFVAILEASGVLQDGAHITYDSATEELAVPIAFETPALAAAADLDFDVVASDTVTLSSAGQATVETAINGAVTLLTTMHGAALQGTDGLFGVVTAGFQGSVTAGSNQFTSADMTFTPALVGAMLNIGDQQYLLKTLVDTHTFELSEAATETLTDQPFTLETRLFTSQEVIFDEAMVGYRLEIGGERYLLQRYVDEHTFKLDGVVGPSAVGQPFLLEQGGVTYVDQAQLNAVVSIDEVDPTVALQLGFVEATVGGGGSGSIVHVAATAGVTLDRNPGETVSGDERFTFREINYGTATEFMSLTFAGEAWAKLKGLTFADGTGSELTIAPQSEVSIYVQDFLDWSDVETIRQSPAQPFDLAAEVAAGDLDGDEVVLVLPDLGPAFDFQHLTAADIVNAIQLGLDFLEASLENELFYNQPLPAVNRSLSEVFSFEDDFQARLDAAAEVAVGSIQDVEAAFEKAMGLTDNNELDPQDQKFSLQLHGQVLDVHVNFAAVFSELYNFSLDLDALLPGVLTLGLLVDSWNGLGCIPLDAVVDLNVDAGIRFGEMTADSDAEVFLYDVSLTRDATVTAAAAAFANPGFAAGSSDISAPMYAAILAEFLAAKTAAETEGTVLSVQATVVSAIDGSSEAADLLGTRQLALLALADQLATDLGIEVTFLTGRQVNAADAAAMLAVPGFEEVAFLVAAPVALELATGTKATLDARILVEDLELGFRVGPILCFAADGYVLLDGDGDEDTVDDYARLTVSLDQVAGAVADDGRFRLDNETLADNLASDLRGRFDTDLEMWLDAVDIDGDEYEIEPGLRIRTDPADGDQGLAALLEQLAVPNPADLAVVYTYADVAAKFEQIGGTYEILGLINDPGYVIDGMDFVLGMVQDAFQDAVSNDVPLIGDKLAELGRFLGDMRIALLADLRAELSGNGKLVETLRESLFEVLGPGGMNFLWDNNGDGQVTIDDVMITWRDADGNVLGDWVEGQAPPTEDADSIQFDVGLGSVLFGLGIDVPLDLNLPGFGLNVNGGLALEATWRYDFGFGISIDDGFYVTTNSDPSDPEFEFHAGAFLDAHPEDPYAFAPFSGSGTLLFFKATLEDQDRDEDLAGFQPGGVDAPLTMDYSGGADGRLTMNTMLAMPASRLFALDFGVNAGLFETLTLEVAGVDVLPKLKADLILDWGWDLKDGLGTPSISLTNVRLDVGTLVTKFLKPIAEKIGNALEPFRDFVVAMTDPLPGLDFLLPEDPTIMGLVNLILQMTGKKKINWAFLYAARDMLELVTTLDDMIGANGEIYLGQLINLGTKTVAAVKGTQADIDAMSAEDQAGVSIDAPGAFADSMDDIQESAEGGTASGSAGGTSTQRSGFKVMEYILDINNWLQMLTGGDATLFTYEMPLLEFKAEFEVLLFKYQFGPVAVSISALGRIAANIDMAFGYDTYGIRKTIEAAVADPDDPAAYFNVLDGFFICDYTLPQFNNMKIVPGTGGQEKDEFGVTFFIGLKAAGEIANFIRHGVTGAVEMYVGADMQDIAYSSLTKDDDGYVTDVTWTSDGKIRGSEIWTMLTYENEPGVYYGPGNMFNLRLKADFVLEMFLEWFPGSWAPIGTSPWEIARIPLFDFTIEAPHVMPKLAHQEGSTLYIHVGPRAGDRVYFDAEDANEEIILYGSGGTVSVEFNDWYEENKYTGVTHVVADMGEGDDTFDASRLSDVYVTVTGGNGKDLLIAGPAGGMLTGNAGNDRLLGGDADDVLTGGDGSDRLYGYGGNDVLDPGSGDDSANGGFGDDTYRFADGYGADYLADPGGIATFDFSACTLSLEGTLSQSTIEMTQGDGNAARLSRCPVNTLYLGSGSDTLHISCVPDRTIAIFDAGGNDDYRVRLGRPNSRKGPGVLTITDTGGPFDEILLEQTRGKTPLVVDAWQVANGRETVNFNSGIDRLTLMGKAGNYDQTNIIDFGKRVSYTYAGSDEISDLKTTGLRVLAESLDLTNDLKAGHFMLDIFEAPAIDQVLNAGNNGYIDIRVYEDDASIHLAADLLVSAGDDWSGEGAGWVRLTAPDGSILNDNGATIKGTASHLILKALDAIGTLEAPILTEVQSLTAATALEGGCDLVVVEADDLNLIARNSHAVTEDPGLIIPNLTPPPEWLAEVSWDGVGVDWLDQIQDGHNYYALASGNGDIDLKLVALDSLLTLESGYIHARAAGTDISLRADDFNFLSGDDHIVGTGDLLIRSTNDPISYRVGGAAEVLSGDDRTDSGDDGYADLSMRDMAAIAHDFEQVTVGHRYDDVADEDFGNVMWIGDLKDATTIKGTGEPRVRDAALQNDTLFLAQRINVQGNVQAPGHVLDVRSRLLEVNRMNVHDPLGLPDSGLYARETILNIEEQALVSGWVKADDRVQIDVWGTTGTNPMMTYDNGPNSLRVDTGALIQALNPGSLIDIDTVTSIKQAGQIEALGDGSLIRIDTLTSFQNLEGGLIVARGSNCSIAVTAGTYLWCEPGSAVTAGARFDMDGDTPVPVLTGESSTIALISPSELWVGGSATSSGAMTLTCGERNFDHADYFDAIPGAVQGETTPEADYVTALQAGLVTAELRAALIANGLALGEDADVTTLIEGKRWLVADNEGHRYVLYLFDEDNDGTAEALQALKPHYLIGHRGFSFLLTGTLTVLQDEMDLGLEAPDDVIVRGNINVLGANGDLTLQSDRWVYWEGFADVVGDITITGGLELDGTDRAGADRNGTSVYVHATSRIVTSGAGTDIVLRGSQDVDIFGAVVAGGAIGANGVTWAGPDSTVTVIAGQQAYVDTGLLAAKAVTVQGGTAGADDGGLSVVITTAGGLTAAGLTSDGSGGLVSVSGATDVQIMGNLLAGGTMQQQFNDEGARIGETFDWSDEDSLLRVEAGGQAWIGGMTVNRQGATVETGGYLRANERIEIIGGANPEGIGVKVAAASEVMAVNPAASIFVDSTGDADIQGYLLAGGFLERTFDTTGEYLGRTAHTYDGDSTIRIEADNQIRIGLDMQAGKSIDLVGGDDPVEAGVQYSGNGIVLYGSVQLSTWRPDSQINLNASGPARLLAPAHTQQIKADTFITTADGRLTDDVTLDFWMDKVDFEVETSVTVTVDDAADNTGIEDLMADVQAALDGASWTVTQSDNVDHPVGSTYLSDGSDPSDESVPPFDIKLYDSRLVFTSPYAFRLEDTSQNGDLLGLTSLATAGMESSLPYVIYAPEDGSTVSIGAPAGPNGKLYIAGKVLAHSTIHLYSGESEDGMDVELDWTGLLETVDGSITLNPGVNAVVSGDVIAGGADSDVTINATNSLLLNGSLQAQRDVILNAGTLEQPGEESIRTHGTSTIRSVGGDGEIIITGLNDVAINSQVGPGSVDLALVRLASTAGDLVVEKESGWIETGALVEFVGHNVEIAGVVRSTSATAASDDFEVTIDIDGAAELHGDVRVAGSLLVDAAAIEVYDQTLVADATGQRVRFISEGTTTFGRFATALNHETLPDGQLYQQGAVISSGDLAIDAGGLLTVGSGVLLLSSAADSTLQIDAGSAVIAGTLYGGAQRDTAGDLTWLPGGAVEMRVDGDVTFGGLGVDAAGTTVTRGGNVLATDHVTLTVGGTLSQNGLSALDVDATAGGTLVPVTPSTLTVTTGGDLQIFGLARTADPGSELHLTAAGQVFVDGLVQTDSLLAIQGGSDDSGAGILVMPLVLQTDGQGNLVDDQGRLIDDDGNLIDAAGQYVDADGNVLTVPPDAPVLGGNPVRLSGGELKTAAGGRITLDATDGISLQGAVGGLSDAGGTLSADTVEITAASTAGAVTVTGRVDAADEINFTGAQVNVLAGGTVRVRAAGGDVRFRAGDTLFVQGASGGSSAALVQAPDLVHLLGEAVRVYGTVASTDGRVLLSAVDEVDVQGNVSAGTDVEVNAGVDADWTATQLESGTLVRGDLTGGSVEVSGAGALKADGDVRVTAGQDLTVASESVLQDGTKLRRRPLVSTEAQTITIVTGYHQVAVGSIQVPEVHWVETTVTEQVGMEEVKIGSVFYTMDTTLTQDGYYNPRAAAGQQFRETFVEGVDYYNSTDYQHAHVGIPVIDWAAFGLSDVPSSNYRSQTYKTFQQLSDDQRNAVLATLGYLPLYDFSYSNPQKHQTIDGNPTTQAWTPAWAGAPVSVYYVDVAGWNDKYIRMPEGANEDVLRVVSQGEPSAWNEYVGEYRDLANVNYVQDRTAWNSTSYAGWPAWDNDNSPARWGVSYNSGGQRLYTITDGRSNVPYTRVPDWEMSTGWEDSVPDVNGTNVRVQTGYRPVTASVWGISTTGSGTVEAGGYTTTTTSSYWSQSGGGAVSLHSEWYLGNVGNSPWDMAPGNYPNFKNKSLGHYAYTWNDTSSSVRVPDGMRIILYEDYDYEGFAKDFYAGTHNFAEDTGYNDEFSSAKVYRLQTDVHYNNYPIYDTLTNYLDGWASVSNNIYDKRLTLHYQWVSNDHDIYGKRPRYETYDTNVKVVAEKTITLWDAEPIVEAQTQLVTSRLPDDQPVAFGAFDTEAFHAGGAVQVDIGGNASVSGLVTAVAGTVTFDAGGDLAIQGRLPVGRDPADTLVADAIILSPTEILLSAGGSIGLGDAAILGAEAGTPDRVQVTAGTTVTFSAQVTALENVVVRAGTDAMLDGVLSAPDGIDVRAGQAAAETGSVTGTFFAELAAANADADIVLHAGAQGGSVTFADSLLSAADRVEILAPAGAVAHGPGGTIIAPNFFVRSLSGIAARTDADDIDVVASGTGDISLTNLRAVTLNADAADGDITIIALGTINASRVETHGASGLNSVSLSAESPAAGVTSDLVLGSVVSGAAGDLTLRAQGAITSDLLGSLLVADELTVEAWMGMNFTTQVNRATLTSFVAGDMSITDLGTAALTLCASVRDGGLTVSHPNGAAVLEDVTVHTNNDDNDVTVTAGGDILIGWLSAGMYYASADDLPDPTPGAEAGVRSLGDVTLTAGGQVAELGNDPDVDLVADVLTVAAQTGFTGLELSVNELIVTTPAGDIEVHDVDSAGESAPGLLVTSALAPAGSVTITAEDYLEIRKVVATGADGTARLTSSQGSLSVVQPDEGEAIEVTSGLALSAAKTLESYAFFQGLDLMEYRAGESWDFNGAEDGEGLPDTLTGGTIVLERGAGWIIGELTVTADRLELASDANVFLAADLLGTVGTLAITARGTRPVHAQVYNEATGQMEWVDQPSGNINIQAAQLAGTTWELRGLRDIYIEISDAVTLTGFVGGLTGADRAQTVTVKTPGLLALVDGTISAEAVELQAQSVTSDLASQVLGSRLALQTTGNITLQTAVDTLAAEVIDGNIILSSFRDVVLERVIVHNGSIDVSSAGNLTALDVQTFTDATGNNIRLGAAGDLYVNYADAGKSAGLSRQHSQVTLDAAGTIREPAGYVDNVAGEGLTVVDVIGWRINLLHGQPAPTPVVVGQGTAAGTGDELEVLYCAANGLQDGGSADGSLPSFVDGDYVLVAPNHSGNVDLTVTGTLYVATLGSGDGQNIVLTAYGNMEIQDDLNAGSGMVQLAVGGQLSASELIAAGSLTVTASRLAGPLTTDVGTLSFEITDPGEDVTVTEANNLTVASGLTNGGDVVLNCGGSVTGTLSADALTVVAGGTIALTTTVDVITVVITGPGDITVTETDDITFPNLITVDGDITVSAGTAGAGTVTLEGNLQLGAAPSNAGTLTVNGNLVLESASRSTIQVNGPQAGTQHDQVRVSGVLTIEEGAELEVLGVFTPTETVTLVLFDAGTVIGAFANVPSGMILSEAYGGTDFLAQILQSAQGVTLKICRPGHITGVVFNDEEPGRSQLTRIAVQFDADVSDNLDAGDLRLENLTTGETIDPAVMLLDFSHQTVLATWTFPGMPGGSLPDGHYRVSVLAADVTGPTGYSLVDDYVTETHRLFGDVDGDTDVDFLDLFNFRKNLDTNSGDEGFNNQMDVDTDGDVDAADQLAFQTNFQSVLPTPGGGRGSQSYAWTGLSNDISGGLWSSLSGARSQSRSAAERSLSALTSLSPSQSWPWSSAGTFGSTIPGTVPYSAGRLLVSLFDADNSDELEELIASLSTGDDRR